MTARGRPALDPKAPSVTLVVRLTRKQRAKLARIALREKVGVAERVRHLIDGDS